MTAVPAGGIAVEGTVVKETVVVEDAVLKVINRMLHLQ